MTAKELNGDKRVYSELIFFRMNWEEITSYEQKHFRETINRSCKVSTA